MPEPTDKPDPKAKPPAPPFDEASRPASPWKRRFIVAGVVVAALLAAYVTGRLQTAGDIGEAQEKVTTTQEQAQQTEKALSSERALVQRLEARRQLHLLLLALDDRNFGIAEKHLEAAAEHLKQSQPESGSEVDEITSTVDRFDLIATEDLGKQRGQVLAWIARFDDAVPRVEATPPAVEAPPATSAASAR